MNRRRLLTSIPALALGLAGCAAPGATPADPVTISFGVYQDFVDRYKRQAEAFTAAHPNVTVEVVPVTQPGGPASDEYGARLAYQAEYVRAFAGAADTFLYGQSAFNSTGYVLDLAPLVQDLDEDDFYPGVLDTFRSDDRLWGIPHLVNLGCLVAYNRAIFAEAGVELPQEGWTQDDRRLLAQALTEADEDRVSCYGYLGTSEYFSLVSVAMDAGGRLDAPEVVEAASRYADMVLSDGSVYWRDWFGDATAWREYYSLISYDRVAMWSTEVYGFGSLREVGRDLGLIEPPGARALAVPWGVGVSAASEHPKECLLWADFLSRQQPLSGMVPARPSVAEDWLLRFPAEDEEATAVALQSLGRAIYPDAQSTEAVMCMSHALVAITKEGAPVESALQQAQTEWDRVLTEKASYPTPTAAPIALPTFPPAE
ncbi:MAG: ABC transporter substrate-binding protein [Anaerolineae bacterium]